MPALFCFLNISGTEYLITSSFVLWIFYKKELDSSLGAFAKSLIVTPGIRAAFFISTSDDLCNSVLSSSPKLNFNFFNLFKHIPSLCFWDIYSAFWVGFEVACWCASVSGSATWQQ